MAIIETDCLVIGAGLAGSAYALHAARAGFRVELLSLGGPLEANSDRAQGGIIFDDTADHEPLARDIIAASDGTANPAAVEQLVTEGPQALRELLLDDLGVDFDRDPSGALDFTREAGHGARRIIHAEGCHRARHPRGGPGPRRHHARRHAPERMGRRRPPHPFPQFDRPGRPLRAADLLRRLCPRYGDGRGGDDVAKKTVLATGGLGGIFLHSTNQPGSVGHGVAMAWRVGARLIDLEYVQFHPTVFYGRNAPRFLITEAVRGEGGALVDGRGRPFMEALDPRGSLAPRDVIARSIQQHLARTGDACVWLDLSPLNPDFIRERFPGLYRRCLEFGVDATKEPIPVVPAAHYSCGGVHTDLSGRTNVKHLDAIGETACTGLHGANRLASTSLLEALVGARAAARADVPELRNAGFRRPEPQPWQRPSRHADPLLISQDLQLVQQTMWNYAGILRSTRRLARARQILLELREEIFAFYRDCRPTRELIELRNAVQTALLVVHAATLNPVSKGCHYVVQSD